MLHLVYKTTNNLNGHYYYGAHSTETLKDGYLGSGRVMKLALKKYGRRNFTREVVSYFETPEEMYEFEELLISEVLSDHKCYNIGSGGKGSMKGISHSEETRRKQSASQKGRQLTEEHRNKLSESAKVRPVQSPEKRAAIAQTMRKVWADRKNRKVT